MSYSDANWHTTLGLALAEVGTGVYTSIASAGVGTVTSIESKAYQAYKAMNILGGSLNVLTAPSSTLQPCTVAIMDGTSTVATAVVTTLAAGAGATFSVVTAAISSGDTLTVNEYGTATASTASGSVTGTYDIELSYNNQFT